MQTLTRTKQAIFSVSQTDLNLAISTVKLAVPSKASHPILTNILVNLLPETSEIEFTGFDLVKGIRLKISGEIKESSLESFTIPSKEFNDLVSRLADGEIVFSVSELESEYEYEDTENESEITFNGIKITLTTATGRYEFRSANPSDFPDLPSVNDDNFSGQKFNISTEALANGFKSVGYAVSTEETKGALTGIRMVAKGNEILFAATDGHRLAKTVEINEEGDLEETAVTISGAFVSQVFGKIFSAKGLDGDSMIVALDYPQLMFQRGNLEIYTKLLDGAYPQFELLIPAQFMGELVLQKKPFLAALDRLSIVNDARNKVVKLEYVASENAIVLSAESQDLGSGRETLQTTKSGDLPESIGFHREYLFEAIKNLDCDEFTMYCNTNTQPIIIKPLSGVYNLALIMPVALRA